MTLTKSYQKNQCGGGVCSLVLHPLEATFSLGSCYSDSSQRCCSFPVSDVLFQASLGSWAAKACCGWFLLRSLLCVWSPGTGWYQDVSLLSRQGSLQRIQLREYTDGPETRRPLSWEEDGGPRYHTVASGKKGTESEERWGRRGQVPLHQSRKQARAEQVAFKMLEVGRALFTHVSGGRMFQAEETALSL